MRNPQPYSLDRKDEKFGLVMNVKEALQALPHYFKSPIVIQGLSATDLFAVNTLLGGAIEEQTVRILNEMRSVWDNEKKWFDYRFVRFPESFPDVRLVKSDRSEQPILGIELKGWYLLSKEAEPSFRYRASADAVTEWDLLVCFPWALSEVLSGVPVVYAPYMEQAKYAADMRTYYWCNRKGQSDSRSTKIIHPNTQPYPKAGTQYADSPAVDRGGNFGRVARIPGLMKEWSSQTLETKLSGIEAKYWIEFLLAFTERNSSREKREQIEKLIKKIKEHGTYLTGTNRDVLWHIEEMLALLDSHSDSSL